MKNVDIHTHGGFGVNFNTADDFDVHFYAREILKDGTVAFCPTLVTDSVSNLNRQIKIIKNASENQKDNEAKILGVHLEACFLNPERKGIHNPHHFLELTKENFKKIDEVDFVKIVTLAPELDVDLIDYLISKNVIIHAGHSESDDISRVSGVTHIFNAMPDLNHKKRTLPSLSINDNNIYTEIIADEKHVTPDILKIFFNVKDKNHIILVSDSTPITHSALKKMNFSDSVIFENGEGENGVLAGSVCTLNDISKNLIDKKYLSEKEVQKMVYDNPLKHLNIEI